METLGWAIFTIIGLWVIATVVDYANSCQHRWGKWGEPTSLEICNSFHSSRKSFQIRLCEKCNQADSRIIETVTA